jgi:hypothetical protein
MHVVETVLNVCQPAFSGFGWHRLGWGSWLRDTGFVGRGEGVSVDESMSRGPSLDLTKTSQVTSFEIAIAMFEFP